MPGCLISPTIQLKVVRAVILQKKHLYAVWKEPRDVGTVIFRKSVANIIARFHARGKVRNRQRGGRKNMTAQCGEIIHALLKENEELTSTDLRRELWQRTGVRYMHFYSPRNRSGLNLAGFVNRQKCTMHQTCQPSKASHPCSRVSPPEGVLPQRRVTDECTIEFIDSHTRVSFRLKCERETQTSLQVACLGRFMKERGQ
ncbi:hypothetical protein BSL78_22522 [Apostichopus japonicus]|uniref:Uncharacterized protein n=1 Tax=Stichopus japonicus TaxID=307972 RepID=A0A2G8JY47_STIJA|nr:hypothetical protein BSL78_22522 [Apostichopus japonicus]